MLDPLDPSFGTLDGQTDGVCLDGKKLLEESPLGSGVYHAESQDFSTITRDPLSFTVVTKAGETRYYGRVSASRVMGTNGQTAIWLLDWVVDAWGNYFDIHYNNDQGSVSRSIEQVHPIRYLGVRD